MPLGHRLAHRRQHVGRMPLQFLQQRPGGEHEHAGVPQMPAVGDEARRRRRHRAFPGTGRPRYTPSASAQRVADLDVAIAGFRRGRLHAEGHDLPGPGGLGGGLQRRLQRRVVGDRGIRRHHPQHRVGIVLRHQQRRRRRSPGRCCGPPAPARCGHRRCRRRATVRRSGTDAPGCRPRSAAANAGAAARSAVSCIIVRSDTSGQSCLGKLSRDTGHSRVPEPPDRITGTIRFSVMVCIQMFAPFWPIQASLPSCKRVDQVKRCR